jgi:hypothetical protein
VFQEIAAGEHGMISGKKGNDGLGGRTGLFVVEWKRLADLEPDPRVRLEYAVDVLVFAELPRVWMDWRQALEGWNVLVSKQVLEWQAIAELKNQRANLVRVLEKRCKAPLPTDLAEAIQATQDMNLLLRWFDAALEANTFDELTLRSHPHRGNVVS